jgi:uncharacterized protein (TIGR02996 family)
MSTEAGLLQAIRETPEDDTPRLIYADWLDDQGDAARAEFIRLRCQAARLGEGDLRRRVLVARAEALRRTHAEEWEKELPRWIRRECRYERGLADTIHPRTSAFARRSLHKAPLVHGVVLTDAAGRIEDLARCSNLAQVRELTLDLGSQYGVALAPLLASPFLRSLRRLEVRGIFLPHDLEVLAAAPCLSELHGLVLGQNTFLAKPPVQAADLASLLHSAHLASLSRLSLDGQWLGDASAAAELSGRVDLPRLRELTWKVGPVGPEGVRALADNPQRRELVRLDLGHSSVLDEGAALLASSPHLEGLEQLDLPYNGIGPEGAESLATGRWSRLHSLALEGNFWLGPDGAAALARLPCLRTLDLTSCGVGEDGTRALASSPALADLSALSLCLNVVDVGGVAALASSPHLRGLEALNLSSCMLHLEGVRALAASRLPKLAALDLGDAFRGDARGSAGVEVLAHSPLLARLEVLGLRDNGLTDAGAWVLVGSAHAAALVVLDLGSNQIGDEGAKALLHSAHLENLRWLGLSGNTAISEEVRLALRDHFGPRCVVEV